MCCATIRIAELLFVRAFANGRGEVSSNTTKTLPLLSGKFRRNINHATQHECSASEICKRTWVEKGIGHQQRSKSQTELSAKRGTRAGCLVHRWCIHCCWCLDFARFPQTARPDGAVFGVG
uniref:Putative secreted protein n=1 Tax=Anopheles darlingi TaxID=43151 RepID=A0A2M4D5F4_ANODA